MRTLESELTAYLVSEADRVAVEDTLHVIEDRITRVPMTAPPAPNNWAVSVIGVAAAVMLIVGLVAVNTSDTGGEGAPAAAQPLLSSEDLPAATVTETLPAPTTTELPPVPISWVPLPAGATLQGLTPTCTTVDSIEYDCLTPDYPSPPGFDMTGTTYIIVDDSSRVSGGCRSTSFDGTAWKCYVGRRAIDEQIVSEGFFGDWAPKGRIEG
jgi:hypothetical protein